MDPVATLQALETAIEKRWFGEAVEALNNYYVWRLKEGHPAPAGGDVRADTLANRLADALDNVTSIRT